MKGLIRGTLRSINGADGDRRYSHGIRGHCLGLWGLAVVRNIGALDRLLRFYLGLVMIGFALPFWAPQTGWNWIGWLGVVPLVSSLAGMCGLYRLIGVTTYSR